MPVISLFNGIALRMYFSDHAHPHFHAQHGEYSAVIHIRECRSIRGRLSRKDAHQVLAFARQRQPELLEVWEKARRDEPLSPIDPPTRV